MLKFIRGKGQQPSAERQKLQRELFSFKKTLQHGFPNKPTCLAWDPDLRIFAIGTSDGTVKVFGKPGVEFHGHHASDLSVTKLIFIPNQGRLVSLCDDNSIHLWEINDNKLEEIKSHCLEGKLKKISALSLDGNNEHLLLGTEGGNVYLVILPSFDVSETIIYQDVVIQNVPENYKFNPGAVESLAIQPEKRENLLIGYNRGLMVLWNMKTQSAEQTYVSGQGVESVSWSGGGRFLSSHNDGSYTVWEVESPESVSKSVAVYGPFSCMAITSILTIEHPTLHDNMIVFTGGMPRKDHGDRHTISVIHGKRNVAFDFTSKVIDFFVAPTSDGSSLVLVCLAEEELVGIDLCKEGWPLVKLPYLVSVHASAVTCSCLVSNVSPEVWQVIRTASNAQQQGLYCDTPWPVDGGECDEPGESYCLLLTGHEDGSVRLWDASTVAMTPLYKFSSSQILTADELDDLPPAEQDVEDWPPFKKVGSFDPYSDDPRLAVKKIVLCPETGILAVGGTSGHVIVAQPSLHKVNYEPKVCGMNIVSSRDGFVWKGHEALCLRKGPVEMGAGLVPVGLVQVEPPACVTTLALQSAWGLVAIGTAHGIALFDFLRNSPVAIKCTLAAGDTAGAGEAPISRRKSFKKSLRESFRRLRRGRSGRGRGGTGAGTGRAGGTGGAPAPPTPSDIETKPVERAVEARSADDTLGSFVRSLTFANTYIITMQSLTATLWAGTNSGTVYVFTITIPPGSKRKEESVSCQIGKEIQLKHRAPVISISLIDGHCACVDTARPEAQLHPPHKVIISSEEQIKVFTVPSLKPVCKLKVTAGEGARLRRTVVRRFITGDHQERCLVCLTNLGELSVLSLPDLRKQICVPIIRREDINGISSVSISEDGEAMYLRSSSELQRVSVSGGTAGLQNLSCRLDLPPGTRPSQSEADDDSSSQCSCDSSSSEGKADKERRTQENEDKAEVKENGVSDSASGHDVTLSSVGDITIDSVKDHITNNVVITTEESKTVTTEVVRNETTKIESTAESVKTSVITTNETVQHLHNATTPTETEALSTGADHSAAQIEVRKAPLARMEEMDGDSVATMTT